MDIVSQEMITTPNKSILLQEFKINNSVIYGTQGRFSIKSIEFKKVGSDSIQFFRLEPEKHIIAKKKQRQSSILLPVETAQKRGLRHLMIETQADQALEMLSNQEYYFSVEEPWRKIKPQLEQVILSEGALGLTKALSYTHVLKQKFVLSPDELVQYHENLYFVLIREFAEVKKITIRTAEELFTAALKNKLLSDH